MGRRLRFNTGGSPAGEKGKTKEKRLGGRHWEKDFSLQISIDETEKYKL